MPKRTLDAFFSPPGKRSKAEQPLVTTTTTTTTGVSPPPLAQNPHKTNTVAPISATDDEEEIPKYTSHATYPCPIRDLPAHLSESIQNLLMTTAGKVIKNQPHLDLLYFQPLVPQPSATELFDFLCSSLPFYRVKYTIARFGKETLINTPRYTTVFGLDETSRFKTLSSMVEPDADPHTTRVETQIVEWNQPDKPVARVKYRCTPRPIPPCLDLLRNLTEVLTGETYNFCLVNYYATGSDSISYHSDDERFLGPNPAIASFTLGAKRDFLMKHKDPPKGSNTVSPPVAADPIKLPLASGDMVLMKGETQSNWLHSIPKRKGAEADKGRINITLRKAMVPGGTENYYRYNVGEGEVYRWDSRKKEMVVSRSS